MFFTCSKITFNADTAIIAIISSDVTAVGRRSVLVGLLLLTLLSHLTSIDGQFFNNVCPANTFGPNVNCSRDCHCLPDDQCNPINGMCSSGRCDPDWAGTACQVKLPALLSSPSIENITLNSICISWRGWNRSLDVGDPFVTSYTIQLQANASHANTTTSAPWQPVSDAPVQSQPQQYRYSIVIDDLDPYTEYTFRIVCNWLDYGKLQVGLPGNESSRVTPITFYLNPIPPLTISTSNETYRSVLISWSPIPYILPGAYSLAYWPTGAMTMTISVRLSGNINSYFVDQLVPLSLYYFQIRTMACAFGSCRWGNFSAVKSYWTAGGRPSAPRDLIWTNRNQSCIQLQWSSPIYPASVPLLYQIQADTAISYTRLYLLYQIRYNLTMTNAKQPPTSLSTLTPTEPTLSMSTVSLFTLSLSTLSVSTVSSTSYNMTSNSFNSLATTSNNSEVDGLLGTSFRVNVCDLLATSRYTFLVSASVAGQHPVLDGTSATVDDVWTALSDRPIAPRLISIDVSSAVVQLTSFGDGHYDVSRYFLVVTKVTPSSDVEGSPSKVDVAAIQPPINASTLPPVPIWTSGWYATIDLSASELNITTRCTIGDGKTSGTSLSRNQPLLPHTLYATSLVVTVRMPDDQSMTSFSWPPTFIETASDANRSLTSGSSNVVMTTAPGVGSDDWCSNCTTSTVYGNLAGPAVSNVQLQLTASDSKSIIGVQWSMPISTGQPLLGYRVSYAIIAIGDCQNISGSGDVGAAGSLALNIEDNSCEIGGLTAWRQYLVTVSALYSTGMSNASATIFSQEIGTISAPTNVRLLNLTHNSATLAWNAVSCRDRGGLLVRYEVRLDDIDFRSDIVVSFVRTLSASFPLLTPYRLFSARVRYVNSVGPGPYSVEYQFRTPATAPPAPRDVNVVNVTSSSALLTWVAPSPSYGQLIAYRVVYGVSNGASINSMLLVADPSTCQANVVGLTSFTVYHVQVQARNQVDLGDGWGSLSNLVTFVTSDGFPSAPTGLIMTSRSENCVTIHWDQPLLLNGLLTNYKLLYTATSSVSNPQPTATTVVLGSSTSMFQACGLSSSTLYTFSLSASTRSGFGPLASLTTWTEIFQPSSPSAPSVVDTTQTTMTLLLQPLAAAMAAMTTTPAVQVTYFVVTYRVTDSGGRRRKRSRQVVENDTDVRFSTESRKTSTETLVALGRHRNRRQSTVPDPVQAMSLPGYTTAQLAASVSSSSTLPQDQLLTGTRRFVVGNGAMYGTYSNLPLVPDSSYIIYFVVALTLDRTTKMAFSQLASPVHTPANGQSPSTIRATTETNSSPILRGYGVSTTSGTEGVGGEPSNVVVPVVVVVLLIGVLVAAVLIGVVVRRRRRQRQQLEALMKAKSRRMGEQSKPKEKMNNNVGDKRWMRYYSNHFYDGSIGDSRHSAVAVESDMETTKNGGESKIGLGLTTDSRVIQVADIGNYMSVVDIKQQFDRLPGEIHASNKTGGVSSPIDTEDCIRVSVAPTVGRTAQTVRYNANFVASYSNTRPRAYIVAQSPFDEASAERFWELVRQERVSTIVAASVMVAETEAAAYSYRPPDGQARRFGRNQVQTVHVRRLANVDTTSFQLHRADSESTADGKGPTKAPSSSSSSSSHRISEYRFLDWSSNSSSRRDAVPTTSPLAFLEFLNKVRRSVDERTERRRRKRLRGDRSDSLKIATNGNSGRNVDKDDDDVAGPLLVHCPTGLGASVIYVAVDRLLDEAATENRVAVFNVVSELRRRRPMAFSSLGEFTFVYDVLSEALGAGYATSRAIGSDLKSIYRVMSKPISTSSSTISGGRTGFDQQFDVLVEQTHPTSMRNAARSGSSAGFVIDSYRYKEGFVLVDVPDACRAESFWRLLVSSRARSVVTFVSDKESLNRLETWTPPAWQKGSVKCFGSIRLDVVGIDGSRSSATRSRTMKVTDERATVDATPIIVRHFVYDEWQKNEPVPSRDEFIRLIGCVEDWKSETGVPTAPIFVQCSESLIQSGLFCVCYIICEKMVVEGQVSLFHTIKGIKLKHHGIVNSAEQYKFCFKVLWEYTKLQKNRRRTSSTSEAEDTSQTSDIVEVRQPLWAISSHTDPTKRTEQSNTLGHTSAVAALVVRSAKPAFGMYGNVEQDSNVIDIME